MSSRDSLERAAQKWLEKVKLGHVNFEWPCGAEDKPGIPHEVSFSIKEWDELPLKALLDSVRLETLEELARRYEARGYREPEMLSTYMTELRERTGAALEGESNALRDKK